MTHSKPPVIISEFFSRSENYKAVVFAEEPKFSVIIYRWNEDPKISAGAPVWERLDAPIMVENQEVAEHLAQKKLALHAGETPDLSVEEALFQEVETTLGHKNFAFLEPKNFSVLFLETEIDDDFRPMEITKILAVEEFYFVETPEKSWCSGFLYQTGEIRCWQKFEDLKIAIHSIIHG